MIEALISALAEAGGISRELAAKNLVRTRDIRHGDYAFPCFMLAKEWKLAPPACAGKLKEKMTLPAGITRAEVAGGYLNFFLDRPLEIKRAISEILQSGSRIGGGGAPSDTVIVEYSSPNIAKPFHIGHLRNVLIGHALDKILRHLGYNVISIDHLGDWGTQFGFVYAGCKLWGKPAEETIAGLLEAYRKASHLRRAQDEKTVSAEDSAKPDVNALAREYFVRLEAGDKEAEEFWKWCLDISLKYLDGVYRRLGLSFDYQLGESFYRDKLKHVEEMIRAKGVLEESRGALGIDLGKQLGFARIFAEDGRSLYFTRDIATADYRYRTYKPVKIIYVVGIPQTLHFQQLRAVLAKIDHPAADMIVHVPYGHVPGISTRNSSGEADRFYLASLLDEAHDRAREAYHSQVSKRPEGLDEELVAEAVGLGAVTFNYLARSNQKDFHFNWDEALNFQGDTGPYLQYALARINGIEQKAREAGTSLPTDFDATALEHDAAYELVSVLSQFRVVLEKVAGDYEPLHLAQYLLTLAKTFSGIYNDHRVLGEEKRKADAHLTLFIATRTVLQTGLSLLGVPPVERM